MFIFPFLNVIRKKICLIFPFLNFLFLLILEMDLWFNSDSVNQFFGTDLVFECDSVDSPPPNLSDLPQFDSKASATEGASPSLAPESGLSRSSTLKPARRNHGISKYPTRRRAKVKPVIGDSDHAVRARNPTGETRHLANPQDVRGKLIVKAKYKEDTMIRFRISPTTGIVELKNEVAKRLELGVGGFDIKYEDDNHDLILMACEEDLQECVDIWTSIGSGVVKLSIHDKITNSRSSCSCIT